MSDSADQPTVNARGLWAGGVATAVVAALVALVGVLINEGVLGVTMVQPPLLPPGGPFAVRYAFTSAFLALLATALAHVLLLTTPRPRAFFTWIVGLLTVVGVVLPFALPGTAAGQWATSGVNLLIGIAIGSLLSSVMKRTVQPVGGGSRTWL